MYPRFAGAETEKRDRFGGHFAGWSDEDVIRAYLLQQLRAQHPAVRPVADPANKYMQVGGRCKYFSFYIFWAIIKYISAHAADVPVEHGAGRLLTSVTVL